MEVIRGKKIFNLSRADLIKHIQEYDIIAIDIGTGDGRFVYELAQDNPNWFCIGIDSERSNLEEYSAKIHKKPSRGGLPKPIC